MSRKQKKMLVRIIVTAVLFTGLFVFEKFVPITSRILRLAVYMMPYLVISYDILKKAFKGIIKGQVFDENFLMAVASVGAVAIAVYENGSYNEAVAVMLFYQIGELFQSYAVGKSRSTQKHTDTDRRCYNSFHCRFSSLLFLNSSISSL